MIGAGMKNLAQQYGLTVREGVAYGSLMGFATTFSEGQGFVRIDIATSFPQPEQRGAFMQAVEAVPVTKEYGVQRLGSSGKIVTVIFQGGIGAVKKVEAFIRWFYPLLGSHGATTANVCTHCGMDAAAGGWYLLDGVAIRLHDSCADQLKGALEAEAQERKDTDTGNYASGALGAILGALLGSVLWALLLLGGYVASVIGFVIGWLAEKGYTLLKGKNGRGKLIILIVAIILGVLVGTIAPDVFYLAKEGYDLATIPELIVLTMMDTPGYLEGVLGNAALGLLFAALGVYSLLRKTNLETTTRKLKKLS